MRSCYNCGGGISDNESFCGDSCESEYNDYIEKDYLESQAKDQSGNSTCSSCGNIEPTDDWHTYYGACGHCVQGVDDEFWKPSPYGNAFNKSTIEGDQSDNAAAAQALSQTIQAPQDRSGDPSRVTGGTPECAGCGETKDVFPLNDEAHICHGCAGDMMDAQAESRTYGD